MSATTEDGESAVVLTDAAAETTRTLLVEQGFDPDEAGLRVYVERGGCAGLSYGMEFVESPAPDDHVYESGGVRVFVDDASHPYLEGSEFAVEETAHGTGFSIENPNAEQECGCGSSFR